MLAARLRTVSRDAPRTTTVSRDSGCSRKTFSRRRITRSPRALRDAPAARRRPARHAQASGRADDAGGAARCSSDKCAQRTRLALRKAANDAARTAFLTKLRHPNGVPAPKVRLRRIAGLSRRSQGASRPARPFPTSGTRRLLHTPPLPSRLPPPPSTRLSSPTVSPSSCVPRLHTPHPNSHASSLRPRQERGSRSGAPAAPAPENIGRKRDTQLSFPLLEHDSSICDMRGAADRIFPRKGRFLAT